MFWVTFIYGLLAGILLVRLSRPHRRRDRERDGLVELARLVMALSLTLAAALFGYVLWRQFG